MADPLVVTLRFLHIAAAVAWVGGTFFWLAVVDPMMRRIPPQDAGALGRHFALRSKLAFFFPVAAVLTVGAGTWLMFVVGADRYPGLQGLVFNIGSTAGGLAIVPGIMAGVQSKRMRDAARRFEAKPDPAIAQSMAARARRLSVLTKVTAGLMVVGVFGMATFQYFPQA
jgi:uncharacterized membrane protein